MNSKVTINQLTKQFYQLFNNTDDKHPGWELIDQLCIPEAMIIKQSGTAQTIYSLSTFIEPRKKMLTDGTLTRFSEQEISQTTNITGNIAQRSSVFEKSGFMHGEHFTGKGNKMFQYINTAAGWKISSVIWEDETA